LGSSSSRASSSVVPDADQHVLQPMASRIGVVHLVGDQGRQPGLARQLGELRHEPVVVRLEVVRELKCEIAVRKVARPALSGVERRCPLTGEQVAWHLPVAASGEADQVAAPLVEGCLHQRALEDRELLLPGQVAAAGESAEGRIAGTVAGQQDEVIAGDRAGMQLAGPAAACPLATIRVVQLPPASGQSQLAFVTRDGQLQADDGSHRGEAGVAGGIGLRLGGCLREADRGV
jgi:hypothetical protein